MKGVVNNNYSDCKFVHWKLRYFYVAAMGENDKNVNYRRLSFLLFRTLRKNSLLWLNSRSICVWRKNFFLHKIFLFSGERIENCLKLREQKKTAIFKHIQMLTFVRDFLLPSESRNFRFWLKVTTDFVYRKTSKIYFSLNFLLGKQKQRGNLLNVNLFVLPFLTVLLSLTTAFLLCN